MLFVGTENLRMLRRLATLYGARPGMLSLLKLARMVVTHIVLTGGIAIGDDGTAESEERLLVYSV